MSRLIASLLLSLFMASQALAAFEEGVHYQRISGPHAPPEDRVEVIEAFAYPCPACRNFLGAITRWEHGAPEYVEFSRLPIALQQGWDLFARAYYTAQVMGLDADAHEAMFKALHDERRRIRNFDDIADVYTPFGVTRESFVATAESFAVDSRMRRNRSETTRLGIRSTPTMVVQGKWRISPNAFSTYEEMLEAVSYLVEREAAELGLNSNGNGNGAADDGDSVAESAD